MLLAQVLASDIQIEDKVDHISLNIDGSLLLLAGSNNVRIMHINDKTPAIEQQTCRLVKRTLCCPFTILYSLFYSISFLMVEHEGCLDNLPFYETR